MQHNYTVINASAGSGKTYALVQKLLMICLRQPSQPDTIRKILALTFTNKAANEMKQRIIDWLKKFSGQNFENDQDLKNIREKLKESGVFVPIEELHSRSKKILDYILHNYSTLNIGTIDKFNSKLVRSFSYELGLAQNFNLEINAEPFLMEAVDKMLDEIGDNNQISTQFMDYVNYSLDNNERVNLNKSLYESAKEYVQDKHYFQLNNNKDFDWKVYEDSKTKLREDIRNLKNTNIELANTTLDLLKEKNLEPSDFADGMNGIGGFFVKFLDKKIPMMYETIEKEEDRIEKIQKGASSKSKNRQDEIFEILDFMLENRRKIIHNYVLSQKKEKILNAILPLKVNKDIQDKLAEIEDENDLVLLSKFNVLIHENLREEPTAFIYEKVGTQFSHYFFDEFQDTSFLQWQNFLPLKEHATSTENMSFTLVGDPKQSIYRFRGGDSQLMLDIINGNEAAVENLENNWRSSQNIVDFNNQLYQYLSTFTGEDHQEIFGNAAQQIATSKFAGRVRVNLIENSTKEVYYEEVTKKMQVDIQNCLDNGFKFSDITILCRGNFDIFKFSQLLGALKVNYNGKEEFIKTISESGLTLNLSSTLLALTEFLRWEQNPKNMQFLVKTMYYLKTLGRISMSDFSEEILEILKLKEKQEIIDYVSEKYNLNISGKNLLQLNLYNFIEHFLLEFSVKEKETDFLFNYLEMLYAYSQNAGSTLKDFLRFWDEEANSTTIQASENLDAIQLMTIHKAKGLEFPVVLLPMENANKDGKFKNWLDVESGNGLTAVNIDSFSKNLEIYDDEMAKFNQENIYQNKIDRFCLQYVATTRAVEQLYFYIEEPNKTSNNLEIYDFISSKIPKNTAGENESSFDLYEISELDLNKQRPEETSHFNTKSINIESEKAKNTEAIQIATPSKHYQNRVEKVRIGILAHEILAQINSEKDVEKTLENYLLAGIFTQSEKDEISTRIYNVIQNEKYAKYFAENQTIINEKDIMISENGESKIVRPDRLINTEKGYVILDFKTGKEEEKHQQQLDLYQSVLEKLGKTVVDAQLIYV